MVEDKVPIEKRKGAIKKLLVSLSTVEESAKSDPDFNDSDVKNVLESINKIKAKLSVEDVPGSKEIMTANSEIEGIRHLLCYLYSQTINL